MNDMWKGRKMTEVQLQVARQRIRDQYIQARFPGVAKSCADLARIGPVVRAARMYFEDRNARRAKELLELACRLRPQAEPLWLAQFELAARSGDAELYTASALEFRASHPASSHWPRICALARSLRLAGEPFSLYGSPGGFVGEHEDDWLHAGPEIPCQAGAAEIRRCLLAAIPERIAA
jgi:hypothetical protein